MSWSLKLRNGDLVTDGAKLDQVTGAAKLVQDLRCAILEKRGTDDLHRDFGSLIDGGYDDQGNWVDSTIGEIDIDFAVLQIESDLRRIMAKHQQTQVARSKRDRKTYGQSTLDNDELLYAVEGIDFTQAQDKLMVNVLIQTGTGQQFNIAVPLQSNT
jgi:hypothetical protein